MTNEAVSYKTLRDRCFWARDRVTRIENAVEAGTPDLNATVEGKDVWIEIKTATRTHRDSTPAMSSAHPLSQEQKNWFLAHMRAGGRGFVYLDTPSRRYLLDGWHADSVNEMTGAEWMLRATWSAPVPTGSDRWAELRKVLHES